MPLPTNNYLQAPKTKRFTIWPYLLLLLWIAVAIVVLLNRDSLYDDIKLFNYTAPANILQLAQQDTMTPYALRMLKVNHPQLMDKTNFNNFCPNDGGEKTIVLGCYHTYEDGIYLLSMGDPRLDGVEQVTAAHEMLHAAYNQLSGGEKTKVDAMLLSYYHHDLKDPRIIATIAEYRKTEPTEVVNEMHSVFGTEVMNLPAGLENYYKRYFTDRQKVAQYAAQYQAEFTSRQNQVTTDDNQLASLLSGINSSKSDLSSEYNQIKSEQSQLSSLASSGNVSAYNALVDQYNNQVDSYNSSVDQLRNSISSYNQLVSERNQVALTENQLYSELSGTQSTLSSK